MNKFDQLDRPLWTDYDYRGSGQDETILHLYNHHFENGLLIMGTATLINSLSHNHRGQLACCGTVFWWLASRRATFGNGRSPRTCLDTFTYNYHGRINSQSRVIDGR